MEFVQKPIIAVQQANIYQGDKIVLTDVNFTIAKSEFVYLIGKTGSGKSSLLKSLYADLPFDDGLIKVAGFDIKKLRRSEVASLRRKIGIIFQDFQLLNDRTVAENMLFVMRATGWKSSAKMRVRVTEVLMKVGLNSLSSKMPHQLSGGEQQRTVIARALINEPMILIADEPTGNLDPEVAEEILNLFAAINRSGTAVLMATHNHQLIEKFPRRTLKVHAGKVYDSSNAPLPV